MPLPLLTLGPQRLSPVGPTDPDRVPPAHQRTVGEALTVTVPVAASLAAAVIGPVTVLPVRLTPGDPGRLQGAEAGGVAVGLGQEVTAVAETVSVAPEVKRLEGLVATERPRHLDHAAQVRRERAAGQVLFRDDPGVKGTGFVGALGGVLGHVARHLLGSLAGRAVQHLDVDLVAPTGDAQRMGYGDRSGGGQRGLGQIPGFERWRLPVDTIGANHGVQVHDASSLVLRHSKERQADSFFGLTL